MQHVLAVNRVLELDSGTMVLRVLLAFVLGAAVGMERELDAQPAGFRTHILICLGAALFGLISVHAFAPFQSIRATSNVQIDVTRVASQVVVGVGFLGGGAILKYGPNVRGLTTAASIWVTAAIGLAVGVGYYWPAVAVTLSVLIALIGLRGFRRLVRRRFALRRETVTFTLAAGAAPGALLTGLHDRTDLEVRGVRIDRDDDRTHVVITLKTAAGILDPFLTEMAQRDDVAEFAIEDR
jgi:putative Mg2+ transporter-C (MgtC) family protein